MRHLCTVIILAAALFLFLAKSASADTYVITLDPAARQEPASGRIVLFFITKEGRRWAPHEPIEGPFFDAPQPIASIEVTNFKPGDSITIDGSDPAFPEPLDALSGAVRVQAILDADQTERSHDAGPGNVCSQTVRVELSPTKDETIKLTLDKAVDEIKRVETPTLKFIRFRSTLLSEFYGRDVYHRAGVALPKQYLDEKWPRQQWPAIYVIPGFGGRDDAAEDYAAMLTASKIHEDAPLAIYIVLDPEAPLGHHGFCDSANNGPRAQALVTELIPHLESKFRLVAKPEARLVTGHSSGGWASLWLQLQHPNVFGGCWSSAPDPIDFSAFQMTDLYSEPSMTTDTQGSDTPSYRAWMGPEAGYVTAMTVRQEIAMEQAIDPNGRSGQQWAAWNAAFSPRDPETTLPVPMFDAKTGEINKRAVRAWSRYDIARIVQNGWNVYGPTLLSKVHLACGDNDSYFLNRAVERFKEKVEHMKSEYPQFVEGQTGGSIEIVPNANHDTLSSKIFMKWNQEMRSHFQKHGLQDAGAPVTP